MRARLTAHGPTGRHARPWLHGGLLVLAALLALLQPGLATAAEPLRAQRVSESAWFVQGEAALGSPANRNFISNAGFVVTADGVVVIDGLGSPALAEELIAVIRQITPQPIRCLIVTHYHADHVYGLQAFKAAGAQHWTAGASCTPGRPARRPRRCAAS